jgi:hypothetical protein
MIQSNGRLGFGNRDPGGLQSESLLFILFDE